METYVINIKNKSSAEDLEKFLKKQGSTVSYIRISKPQKYFISEKNDFFNIYGLWKDSDISLEKIREKAWKRI